jgi:pimeloyl-ACP methyl ester carboxylesterase
VEVRPAPARKLDQRQHNGDRIIIRSSSKVMATEREVFIEAQQRMLERYRVEARSRFIDVPSIGGKAHVLVAGEGPPVVMINGIGIPGAMLAPLMAQLDGLHQFVVDLPAYGLTDTTPGLADNLRRSAVHFLEEVLDGLGLDRPPFVGSSLGSLWTSWLALDRPERVAALVHLGCPALALDTSAPLPMRVLSVRPLGRLLTKLQSPSPKQVEQLAKMVKEHPLVPELVDLIVATERLPGFRQTFLTTIHAILRLRGSQPELRLTSEQLAGIDRPTLLFWGENDPFGSHEVGERIAVIMPDAELQVVGGGHAPWLTQADRIGPRAARFLHEHA